MIQKKTKSSRRFHLSYDVKVQSDTELKEQLTVSLLSIDVDALLTSPVLSTILIESEKDFEEWEVLLNSEYRHRLFYVISEVRQENNNYVMDMEINDEINNPYQKKVKKFREKQKKQNIQQQELDRIKFLTDYKR